MWWKNWGKRLKFRKWLVWHQFQWMKSIWPPKTLIQILLNVNPVSCSHYSKTGFWSDRTIQKSVNLQNSHNSEVPWFLPSFPHLLTTAFPSQTLLFLIYKKINHPIPSQYFWFCCECFDFFTKWSSINIVLMYIWNAQSWHEVFLA